MTWTSRTSGSFGASSWTSSTSAVTGTSSAGVAGAVSAVVCSGDSCSVTLAGEGSRVQVMGTGIAFGSIHDRRATIRVRDREVDLAEGETVVVDRVALRCTRVTRQTVTLEASPA
jgi:hypothetical protein